MNPDLEIVPTHRDESFRAWVHDPHSVAKWHFHPEYEIHLIQSSHGKMFVGDHIGDFGPGNLIVTGRTCRTTGSANSPTANACVARRRAAVLARCDREDGRRVQRAAAGDRADRRRARGVQFPDRVGRDVAPLMLELANAHGCRRVEILMSLFDRLSSCRERRVLAGRLPQRRAALHVVDHQPGAVVPAAEPPGMLRETDVAAFAGMSVSTFTRFSAAIPARRSCAT